jgi:hypothetical protein
MASSRRPPAWPCRAAQLRSRPVRTSKPPIPARHRLRRSIRRLVPFVVTFHGETPALCSSLAAHVVLVSGPLQSLTHPCLPPRTCSSRTLVHQHRSGWSWTLLNLRRAKDLASVVVRSDKIVMGLKAYFRWIESVLASHGSYL